MIILIFLLLTTEALAQNCLPADRLEGQSLRGCDAILKREETTVVFPGYSTRIIQEGTGQCAKRSSCDPTAYMLGLTGKEECWPQFNAPVISYGSWKRVVVNSRVVNSVVGSCYQRVGDHYESVQLFGPRCAPGNSTTYTVYHSCGPTYSIPVSRIDPCIWYSFTSGIPCWIYQQPMY